MFGLRPGAPKRNLKLVIVVAGTRGDVQPCIALSLALSKQGHRPLVLAPEPFRALCSAHDVPFSSLGEPAPTHMLGRAAKLHEVFELLAPWLVANWSRLAETVRAACGAHGADAVLATAFALPFTRDVCAAGIGLGALGRGLNGDPLPVWGLHFACDLPTRARAPAGYETWLRADQHGFYMMNMLMHVVQLVRVAYVWWSTGLAKCRQTYRKQRLGLEENDPEELHLLMHTPSLFGVSRHALPRGWPRDYPPCNHCTGFWLLDAPPGWTPPDKLARFCGVSERAGGEAQQHGATPDVLRQSDDVEDQPVCVTFGSMREVLVGGAGGTSVLDLVTCLRATFHARVILIGPPMGDQECAAFDADDGFCHVEGVPHDWLFPRCRLVIHHGGAGTTARCMLSAVPQIVCPHFRWADQVHWAADVQRLGVGVAVTETGVQGSRQMRRALANLLKRGVARDRAYAAAIGLARRLRAEGEAGNGATIAARLLERDIELQIDGKESTGAVHSLKDEPEYGCTRLCVMTSFSLIIWITHLYIMRTRVLSPAALELMQSDQS